MRRSWMLAAISLLFMGQVMSQEKWVNVSNVTWDDSEGKKFKIDNCNLMVSRDGNLWDPSPDNQWKDRSGATFRLMNQKVERSTDGNNWMEESKWEDMNGHQFRLNDGCTLYTLQVEKVDLKWDSKRLANRINQRLSRLEAEINRLNNAKMESALKRQEKLVYSRDQLKARLAEIQSLQVEQWPTFKTRVDSLLSIR